MRVLIYGFGPYRHFKENITDKILRNLPEQKGLKKIVFPVRFDRNQFINAIKEYRPDVILGLGQCSKGRLLRIESAALNQRRTNQGEKAEPIAARGSPKLLTNLKLNLGPAARFSDQAGDYVCNYSMYIILDFLRRGRLPIPFGFIHIPQRHDKRKALRLLLKAIYEIRPANNGCRH